MKQFTTSTTPVEFAIDDDTFHCPAEIPAGMWLDLINLNEQLSEADTAKQFGLVTELFSMVLPEDEYKVFDARLHDRQKPIGMMLLVDIIEWLLGEAYGMRPTPPSSRSSGSSEAATTGASSTAGVLPEALTLAPSPGPDSST